MKRHPRTVQAAHGYADITVAVAEAVDKYDLTWAEISHILADVAKTWAGYHLQDERKPDAPDEI